MKYHFNMNIQEIKNQIKDRNIKFRAWDSREEEMYNEEKFLMSMDGEILDPSTFPFTVRKDCILLQYTGLKDKNGKEIYEGDILGNIKLQEDKMPIEIPKRIMVFWFNRESQYWVRDCNLQENPDFDYFSYDITIIDGFDYEVIGNIFENPDLI